MSKIYQFPRYTGPENFVTNNTLLLLSRVYQIDPHLLEAFFGVLSESNEISLGPTFSQQKGAGGLGIPDGMIVQQSFRIVVETKLHDNNFWGKEDYVSHFQNESSRVLLTISKLPIHHNVIDRFKQALLKYDAENPVRGNTLHKHLTFSTLIEYLRFTIDQTRSRHRIELEELIEDYEDFLWQQGLINDVYMRMHVFAVNDTEEENLKYNLYYNTSTRNESPHKFVGLYRNKTVRYICEVKTVVIPRRQPDGSFHFEFKSGEENFTPALKQNLTNWLQDEGWGDNGSLKFHLFEKMCSTKFLKTTPGGIRGPRHFYLNDYIQDISPNSSAQFVAEALFDKEWE